MYFRWGFITHGCIDGYSRLIAYAQCRLSATADTVLNLFVPAVKKYGLPSRVRSDHGYENILVAVLMNVLRGPNRNSHIAGQSVHNQRIERLWRDIYEHVIMIFYDQFYKMESDGTLNPENNLHRFVLQTVYLNEINMRLSTFIEGWNRHKIRTERNLSPRELWISGLLDKYNSNSTGVYGVFEEGTNIRQRLLRELEELNLSVDAIVLEAENEPLEHSSLRAEIDLTNEQKTAFEDVLKNYTNLEDQYIFGVNFLSELLGSSE